MKYEDYNDGPYLSALESAGYVLSTYSATGSTETFYALLCPDGLRLLGLNGPDGYTDVLAQGWAHYKNKRRLSAIEGQARWLEHKCGEMCLKIMEANNGDISPVELLDQLYQLALDVSTTSRPALETDVWHIDRERTK